MARFDDLAAFAAVVRAGSFTRAAVQIGVTQSALSQTVRALVQRLDLKLLNRTTRSIAPTEAGERLYQTVESRFADIEAELAVLGEMRGRPRGTGASKPPSSEITAVASASDLVADVSGDQGRDQLRQPFHRHRRQPIRHRCASGRRCDQRHDRSAHRTRHAHGRGRQPGLLRQSFRPSKPEDLTEHDCIGLRLPTHGGLMSWEFKRRGRSVNAQVAGRLVFNNNDLTVSAALIGQGLAWVPEDITREHVYYASRRASTALALVIEALRR